ncbi:MAG: hypothetical protein ACYTBV_02265 [Planctomycetota bacterium]|jgi:hypothetical protein
MKNMHRRLDRVEGKMESIAKHKERKKRKPVKFKTVKGDSGKPTLYLQDPDDPLRKVKMSEALGTADADLQGHLLVQVVNTFREVKPSGSLKAELPILQSEDLISTEQGQASFRCLGNTFRFRECLKNGIMRTLLLGNVWFIS